MTPPPPRYDHVIWIWMENHRRDQVVGSPDAPFATSLAGACGSATDYRTVGRPSLPNYLAATSGGTHGVQDDAPPSDHPIDADNLFRQVRRSGGSARTFAEAMPGPCTLRSEGRYAVSHNPAAYYVGADDRRFCASDDVPLGTPDDGALAGDLATGGLPTFLFVVPDVCHDTHNCAVAVGDRWLAGWLGRVVGSPIYRAGTTAVFVVWDEPSPMPFLVVAPAIHPGATTSETLDHYALLRTTEDLLGIGAHLGAADHAPSLRPLFGM